MRHFPHERCGAKQEHQPWRLWSQSQPLKHDQLLTSSIDSKAADTSPKAGFSSEGAQSWMETLQQVEQSDKTAAVSARAREEQSEVKRELLEQVSQLRCDKRVLERRVSSLEEAVESKDAEVSQLQRLTSMTDRLSVLFDEDEQKASGSGMTISNVPSANEELLMATIEAQDEQLQQLELRSQQLADAMSGGLSAERKQATIRLEDAAEQLRTVLQLTKPTSSMDATEVAAGKPVSFTDAQVEDLAKLLENAHSMLLEQAVHMEYSLAEMSQVERESEQEKQTADALRREMQSSVARNHRLEVENQLAVDELCEQSHDITQESAMGRKATQYLSRLLDSPVQPSAVPLVASRYVTGQNTRFNPPHARNFEDIHKEKEDVLCRKRCKNPIQEQVTQLKERFARAGVWLPLEHIKANVYRFQKLRKLSLAIHGDHLVVRVGGGFQHLVDYLWDRLDKQYPLSVAAGQRDTPELQRVLTTPSPSPAAAAKGPPEPELKDPRVAALQKQLRQRHRTDSELFYASDKNRDNKLNLEEFTQGVAMMGVRPVPRPSDMHALFDAYDGDGNGWITWDELHQMFGGDKVRRTGRMVATVKATLGRA